MRLVEQPSTQENLYKQHLLMRFAALGASTGNLYAQAEEAMDSNYLRHQAIVRAFTERDPYKQNQEAQATIKIHQSALKEHPASLLMQQSNDTYQLASTVFASIVNPIETSSLKPADLSEIYDTFFTSRAEARKQYRDNIFPDRRTQKKAS